MSTDVRGACGFAMLLALVMAIAVPGIWARAPQPTKFIVYVGTYGNGIFAYRFNAENGELHPLGLIAKITNPSFLACDRAYHNLYAVSELNGNVKGEVAAFAISQHTGSLKLLTRRSSQGEQPCHLSVDGSGQLVFVANYGTGEVAVFPIQDSGKLGDVRQLLTAHGSSVNPERQQGPHAHEAVQSGDQRFMYVPDLGLDQIRVYELDAATRKFNPAQPPFASVNPGNGPRHIAFTSDGKFAYLANELKPVVTVFARNPTTGALTSVQEISTLPEGFAGESAPAEIALDRADKFLYVSNRRAGTIAVFAVTSGTGTLTQIQSVATGGTMPRAFAIDPTGTFLFCGDQQSNKFVLYRISPETGKLELVGNPFDVPSPVSFVFVPAM